MAEKTPIYSEEAQRLNEEYEALRREQAMIEATIERLQARRDVIMESAHNKFLQKEAMRVMSGSIKLREQMVEETAGFPLINAINEAALEIFLTTKDPLKLARSLNDGISMIYLPIRDDEFNMRLIAAPDKTENSPFAIVRAGTMGDTTMVLFDRGLGKDTDPDIQSVVLHIGGNMLTAYKNIYKKTVFSNGETFLIQHRNLNNQLPAFHKRFDINIETHLRNFIGPLRYNAALDLLKPQR